MLRTTTIVITVILYILLVGSLVIIRIQQTVAVTEIRCQCVTISTGAIKAAFGVNARVSTTTVLRTALVYICARKTTDNMTISDNVRDNVTAAVCLYVYAISITKKLLDRFQRQFLGRQHKVLNFEHLRVLICTPYVPFDTE